MVREQIEKNYEAAETASEAGKAVMPSVAHNGESQLEMYAGGKNVRNFSGLNGTVMPEPARLENYSAENAISPSYDRYSEGSSGEKGYGYGHPLRTGSSGSDTAYSGQSNVYKAGGISGGTPSSVNGGNNGGSPNGNTALTENTRGFGTKKGSSLSKKPLTTEERETERLARINANYEHDKAVLAKADPMFAKNQFWDVGHAEGSGEMTEREIGTAAKELQEDMLEKLKGKQI